MDLKTYMKENGMSVAKLSRTTYIPYTTLGDLVAGRTDVDDVGAGVVHGLAKALGVTMDGLYEMAKELPPLPKLKKGWRLRLRDNRYYIAHDGGEEFLCALDHANGPFIKDIAEGHIRNYESERRAETWQEWAL